MPAEQAGPNATRVLTRLSEKTLRVGLPGAFTYDGFHTVILPLLPEVAAQAALDRAVFAGGCAESSDTSVEVLQAEILNQYQQDFSAQWDGFLHDIRLAPITDLQGATLNLKDLASPDSALKRLLTAVVAETNLLRVVPEDAAAAPPGLIKAATKRLGKVGKLIKAGSKIAASSGDAAATGALPGTDVAAHFADLRGVVEEVDGQPPKLADVELAFSALANELQTVANSPTPEAIVETRGGLANFTGALVNVSASLPDPIDDWVAGIATDTIRVTQAAVVAQLNARWRADVLPFCTSATRGRYPFDQSSAIDVNVADFQRLFGPGGLIDKFTTDNLEQYVDTTARPWDGSTYQLDAATLAPFERARAIRDALFPGGAGPIMAFILEAKDLSPNASRITLNLDGQALAYFNSAVPPAKMVWPGPDGTNLITLSFAPVDGSPEVILSETGAWAWLRLIKKSRMSRTELPELFRLRLAASGFSADFDLRATSVDNPFDLTMFGSFSCPDKF